MDRNALFGNSSLPRPITEQALKPHQSCSVKYLIASSAQGSCESIAAKSGNKQLANEGGWIALYAYHGHGVACKMTMTFTSE